QLGNIYDVIIIGAGQAGIAMSYQLKQKGINNCLMIDAQKRIGDSWRFRYKSLVLFTTKSYSALPGLEMKGDPISYPTKNEMADYLEDNVAHFALHFSMKTLTTRIEYDNDIIKLFIVKLYLPYRMKTLATRIEKENDFFNIFTVNENFQSRRVIVASGAFQKPYIPPIIKNENPVVSHVHSSLYTEPKDLNNGTAL